MNGQERDELGQIVRTGMQAAGISDVHRTWDQIGEVRRERHRVAADDIFPAYEAWKVKRETLQRIDEMLFAQDEEGT